MGPLFFSRCQRHVGGRVWAKARACVGEEVACKDDGEGVQRHMAQCAWVRQRHVTAWAKERACNDVWEDMRTRHREPSNTIQATIAVITLMDTIGNEARRMVQRVHHATSRNGHTRHISTSSAGTPRTTYLNIPQPPLSTTDHPVLIRTSLAVRALLCVGSWS